MLFCAHPKVMRSVQKKTPRVLAYLFFGSLDFTQTIVLFVISISSAENDKGVTSNPGVGQALARPIVPDEAFLGRPLANFQIWLPAFHLAVSWQVGSARGAFLTWERRPQSAIDSK